MTEWAYPEGGKGQGLRTPSTPPPLENQRLLYVSYKLEILVHVRTPIETEQLDPAGQHGHLWNTMMTKKVFRCEVSQKYNPLEMAKSLFRLTV